MADHTTPAAPPPAAPEDPVAVLEGRLGLPLGDRGTALAALTHKSFVNEHRGQAGGDNERLEFLGDAVIDLAVSHRLMERFPGAREGDLSKLRAAVVDEQGLASLARELGLGELLRLGRGEELTGGRRKASLLADAMEAVIAAVYLDGGLPAVLGLVDRFLGAAFQRAAEGTLDRDYKTQLQELAQSRVRAVPRYRVVAEHGPDHAKVFEVALELKGEPLGTGQGRSKKDAEQAAAKAAIEALQRRLAEAAAAAGGAPTSAPPGAPEAAEAGPAAGAAGEGEAGEGEAGTPPEEAAGEAPPPGPAPEVPAPLHAMPEGMEGSIEPVVEARPPAPAGRPKARPARVTKKKAAAPARRKAPARKAAPSPRAGKGRRPPR